MTVTLEVKAIDETKLAAFMGTVVNDFAATASSTLAVIGDRLGLYKAMVGAGAMTAAELARRTGTVERYIHDWLVNQAAGGYIEYDAAADQYTLPDEHALVLAHEDGPFNMTGGFYSMLAISKIEPRITEVFKTGGGVHWGEHDEGLFLGTERLFRPGYRLNLVNEWIPALEGVEAKLTAGATVADVGCGYGASTIIMAQAFPNSRFYGFDNHALSIETARERAREAGVADRVTFEVASAEDFPGSGYDLIAYFDCLHDMGDPEAATRHAYEVLAPDGTVLIVEPQAGDQVEGNLNPVGRLFAASSVLICTPNGMASGGKGLGTLATEPQLREVVTAGGFTYFRRATENGFNRIFEAKR